MKNLSTTYFIIIILILIIIILISFIHLHPVLLILMILLFRILTCLILSIWKINYIFSIITFLIIIRGLLVIFLYFSRLISNEKTILKLNKYKIFIFIIYLLWILYLFYNRSFYEYNYISVTKENTTIINLNESSSSNLIYLYSHPYSNYLILSIFFLLFCIFIIIKISSINIKPLRKIK